MKTPDEIKKGLEIGTCDCDNVRCCKDECPYERECSPGNDNKNADVPQALLRDALAYIRQLEEENEKLQRYCDAEADRAADAHHNMMEAEASVPRWIPVEERLPESYVRVIGYLPNENKKGFPPIREVFRMDNCWVSPALGELCIVTHWMPMPEPPKEEHHE